MLKRKSLNNGMRVKIKENEKKLNKINMKSEEHEQNNMKKGGKYGKGNGVRKSYKVKIAKKKK